MTQNKVLATVNGKSITETDLNNLMRSLPPQQSSQFNSEQGKEILLNELIGQELFYFDALSNNVDREENFQEELKKVKENVLKQYAIRKELSQITISDEEVEEYYKDNKLSFQKPEEVNASHILVDTKEEAEEIKNKIENGESFEAAAKEFSKCPSKDQGGNLGNFSKGKMVPEFETAAFDMNKGEISDPVKTQFGYHLIKLNDKQDSKINSYEDVKDNLKNQLLSVKQSDYYKKKIEKLKEKYKVEINK